VRAAGAGSSLPPDTSRFRITLKRSGDAVNYQAAAVPATPGYFSALQMRLLKGRFFTDADDDAHPPVMIMSEDTARRFFGDDALGRTMTLPQLRDGQTSNAEMTLVGIIANVKYAGLAAPPDDAVYRPFTQQPMAAPFLVVRTSGDPAEFAATLRRDIAAVDRNIVVSSVATADSLVSDAAAQPQFRTVLLGSVAALALSIAAVGLYSVVAYAVARRTKEIGIRVALGATSHDVLGMVLGEGMIIAAVGIGGGIAAALALTRLLAGLLYGIAPTDPVSFAVASAGLLVFTLVASYVPARRAASVDPIGALRQE
jgi:predicted permease